MATHGVEPGVASANLFDGDLSPVKSNSGSAEASTLKRQRSKAILPSVALNSPRPTRHRAVVSYQDSDTEEEEVTPSSKEKKAKRKRQDSLMASPSKKPKLNPGAPRARATSMTSNPSFRQSSPPLSQLSKATSLSPIRPSITRPARAFIRLASTGELASAPTIDGYWWPAKAVETSGSACETYKIYADDGYGHSRHISVRGIHPECIQTVYNPKPPNPRFTGASFQSGTTIEVSKFASAISSLFMDEEDDDGPDESAVGDDLEELALGSPRSKNTDWRPPSPTEFENLVDSRVLCKGTKGSIVYWPGKILSYVPPLKSSQKPRFQVDYFDWKSAVVTRDMFYTQYDEDEKRFATCELDSKKLQEWVDKNSFSPTEGEGAINPEMLETQDPLFPIPKPALFIAQLTIQQQFGYVKPFLSLILTESYAPSQERIDAWMRGGLSRSGITNNPIQGGNLAEVEWHTFGRLVKFWALGDLLPVAATGDAAQENVVSSHKASIIQSIPTGSERYEALPLNLKLQFVVDVLIGEAVIQLLIIRAGVRTTLDRQDAETEANLYRAGVSLAMQESTSITVRIVLDARREIRKRLGLPAERPIAAGAGSDNVELSTRRSQMRHNK